MRDGPTQCERGVLQECEDTETHEMDSIKTVNKAPGKRGKLTLAESAACLRDLSLERKSQACHNNYYVHLNQELGD